MKYVNSKKDISIADPRAKVTTATFVKIMKRILIRSSIAAF